jgi:hypothetical protein
VHQSGAARLALITTSLRLALPSYCVYAQNMVMAIIPKNNITQLLLIRLREKFTSKWLKLIALFIKN